MWQRIRCNEVSNAGNDPRGGCVDSVCCCVSPARKVCLSVSRVSISTLTGRMRTWTRPRSWTREGQGLRGDDCSLDTFPGRLISISATKGFIRRHSPRTRRGRRSQVNGGAAKTSSVLRIETFSGPWRWGSLNVQRYISAIYTKSKESANMCFNTTL